MANVDNAQGAMLYPYSTQATNRNELIFFFIRGGFVRFHSKKISNRESVPIQIRSRYEYSGESVQIAQEFITISKITLEHAARKLRNQLRSYEYAERSTNWAQINRNPRRFQIIMITSPNRLHVSVKNAER